MKAGQYFALTVGIIYVLLGIAGFIPGLMTPPMADPDLVNLSSTKGYGYLLGLLPTNILGNVVRLLVGFLGILGSISLASARLFSGGLALSYGLLAVLGLFLPTQSLLGFMPLFGNNVWLHALTAAIATYFGFIATPDLAELGQEGVQKQTTSS